MKKMLSKKNNKHTSQSIGLDIALALANFVTGKDNLHYGIWDELEVNLGNLYLAQEAYNKKLLSHLPKAKKLNILDVGGGAGETAKKLISLGHAVTIIVPSSVLASRAKENTENKATVKLCTFEDYKPQKNEFFDLCLFSESFQYLPLSLVLRKAKSVLNDNGKILISDCFRSDAIKESNLSRPPGGGHLLSDMYEEVISSGYSIEFVEEITNSVSGSIDLEQKFYNMIGFIIKRTKESYFVRHPILFSITSCIYKLLLNKKKRIRLRDRLFEKSRNSTIFEQYNHYMIFLLKPIN